MHAESDPPGLPDDVPGGFRFVAMADIQTALPIVHEVFEKINEVENARYVVAMGDITERGYIEEYELFDRQFRGGVTSRLDPLRGEAALAKAASTVPDIERRIVAKENELSVLLGRPAGEIPRGTSLAEQIMPAHWG